MGQRLSKLARRLTMGTAHENEARMFRRGARDKALETLVRLRIVIAPLIGGIALTFAFFEPTLWRRAVIVTVVTMLHAVSYTEWVRYRRQGLEHVGAAFNLTAMLVGQLALVISSGGLFSPLLPAIFVMAVISAMLLDRRTQLLVYTFVAVPTFWTLAYLHASGEVSLVPVIFGGAVSLERSAAPWIAAALCSLMGFGSLKVGRTLRQIFEQLFEESLRERDRALDLHAEQSRTLSALSAEIAHELKNPLASVKGLGALVARDVTGKTEERVSVLRREVDRMQGILEELLTFSRPLVPLCTELVDPTTLADEIVSLHEGLALERRVELVRKGKTGVSVQCDPRKVRQVLMNLVQNAIDASPAGARVEITVRPCPTGVAFDVRDRGEGVSPELKARVFDPGVTSKERGSGIGLAVARSLARQHGGDLVLEDADGGGAIATLTLPFAVAEAAE